MDEFTKERFNEKKIEMLKRITVGAVTLIAFILGCVIGYNLLINLLAPEDVTLHFFKDTEYTEPASFETYIKDNGYEKVTAVFEKNSIHIEGVDRSYTKINDNTLGAYWDYHGYTPDKPEEKTIYYNGDKLYTKYKLNKKYEEQMYDDVTGPSELFSYRLFSVLFAPILGLIMTISLDVMGLEAYIRNYYDEKKSIKL